MPLNFNKQAQKGNQLLNHLAAELGDRSNRRAGRILRTVLHTLRNHLTLEENFQLIAQLPMALKALYIDGWKPGKPKVRGKRKVDFIMEIISDDTAPTWHDFATTDDVKYAMGAVFTVLKKHLSSGEFKDIIAVLPKHLKELIIESLEYESVML